MAIITFDGGQSSTATNSQSTTYIAQKVLQMLGPAAPDTLVASVLQDVIREFYAKGTWRKIVGPYLIVQGRDTIYLNPVDQYSQLQYVLQPYIYPGYDGGNTRQFLRPSPRKIVGSDTGPPSSFWMEHPDKMVLYPVPDRTYGRLLMVDCFLVPIINTPQLPAISTTHHLDALEWGTLARMFSMPKRPWSDKTLAQDYRLQYRREIMRYRDECNRAYGPGDTPFSYPPFAGGFQNGGSQAGARNAF